MPAPHPARRRADPFDDFAARIDETAGETRTRGLRRLSKLTWRSVQLSALATVGFVTLFVRTAPAEHTVSSQAKVTPSPAKSTASPSPTPTHKKKHHEPRPSAAPSAAPAPSPTLAPPATAPAPPPPSPTPAPVQTTSSGSSGG